ncbi:MAG: TatD family hydrolase [Armatimonadetes bacterium]|nr:TatD family hydrolase [Armatimonadota bacterium]
MALIDTHTHLQFRAFDADRDAVLQRAAEAGVERIVVVGCDLPSSRAAVALAAEHAGRVYAAVGVHPHEAASLDAVGLAELRRLAARPGVVAIGECGLDYYRDRCPRDVQQRAFALQQRLAVELGLPLVVHSREAVDDVLRSLAEKGGSRTRVVLHCFTTDPEAAERVVAAGCWLGMDGPVTYPKATDAHRIAQEVPLARLLLETDCPYLAPQAVRGKRCEPAHVRAVAERVAELRGMECEELAAATAASAAEFFGWP